MGKLNPRMVQLHSWEDIVDLRDRGGCGLCLIPACVWLVIPADNQPVRVAGLFNDRGQPVGFACPVCSTVSDEGGE